MMHHGCIKPTSISWCTVVYLGCDLDSFWSLRFKERVDALTNDIWLLVRHKAAGDFCKRLGRDHRFKSRSRVSSPHAIDLEHRAKPVGLHERMPLFLTKRMHPKFLLVFFSIKRHI